MASPTFDRSRAAIAAVVAVCVCRAAAGAEAGPDATMRATARAKLVDGVAMLKRGDYDGALARFQEAYVLVPSPNIQYDFGLAYVGLGRSADALEAFERFLAEATDAPPATREKAEANRRGLRPRVAALTITTDVGGAEVLVDGRTRGITPLARPIYVEPGSHQFAARRPGSAPGPAQTVDVAAGAVLGLRLVPTPAPSLALTSKAVTTPPAPALLDTSRDRAQLREGDVRVRRGWAIAAGSTGAALLGAGLTFGLLARHESNNVTRASDTSMPLANPPHLSPFIPNDQTLGKRFDTLMTISLSAGAVALLTGVIAFATTTPAGQRAAVPF
jgi:hypothetical protein